MSQLSVPVFSVQTALATASDSKNSLDGIDLALGQYESGTVGFVRATNSYYRYDAASAAVPDGVTVVQPLSGSGRWLLLSSSVAAGQCAVLRVAQDGSGDFTTIEAALAFANANATATEPYTLVVCPGQYTPAATLPFTNQYVSMRAEMPMTVSIVAAVGVTPLIQLGSASVSPFPAQCFDGLVLSRQDGDVGGIVAITNGDTGFVFFRECMFLGDSATGILANPTNSTTVICHESFAVGLDATGAGGGMLDIAGSSSVVWIDCPCFGIGRFATIKSNLSSLNCTGAFVDSFDSTTVRVEAGLFQCSNTILINSSGGAAWNVLCDGPSAQARLSDVQCDLGGLSARQYTAFGGHATIRAVGCVVENATTALDVDDGYIYALGCKVMNAGTVVAIVGLNAPRIFVEGGDVPIPPGAPAITGLTAYTGDQETNGDALVCYNGTAPAQQLRLDQTFVPASSADAAGVVGNIAWGSSGGTDYIYVKFPAGWRRVALAAF